MLKSKFVIVPLLAVALTLSAPGVAYAGFAEMAKAKAAEILINKVMGMLEKKFTESVAKYPISEDDKAAIVKKLSDMAKPLVKKTIDAAMGGSLPNPVEIVNTIMKDILPQLPQLVAMAKSSKPAAPAEAPPAQGAQAPQVAGYTGSGAEYGAPVQPPAPPPEPKKIILTPVDWTVTDAQTWIDMVNGVRTGGDRKAHTVTINTENEIVVPVEEGYTFGTVKHIKVVLDGRGVITLAAGGSLLIVGADQRVSVNGSVVLKGRENNSGSVVVVDSGATFRLDGWAQIISNSVSGDGGGVSVLGGGSCFLAGNAVVAGNSAKGSGGGVYISHGKFGMQDSARVYGNAAGNGGGGVYVEHGVSVMVGNATVSGNNVWFGGGVYVGAGGTLSMSGSAKVSENTAKQQGGGVYFAGNEMNVKVGAAIVGNTAGQQGGGVYFAGWNFAMRDSAAVLRNVAGGNGGGVYALVNSITMSDNAAVAGNTSTKGAGGGVYLESKTLLKQGGTIYGGDADMPVLKNTAAANRGNAVYYGGKTGRWRNATAGKSMGPDSYGFWLND
jgi:hypothetical protein